MNVTFKEAEAAGVNKAELQMAVEEAKSLKEEGYTAISWAVFAEAQTNAEAVLANEMVSQEVVDDALDALLNAIDALEEKPAESVIDKTLLRQAADAAGKLAEAEYTRASYGKVKAAKTAADVVLSDDKSTQDAVDEALANLNEAVDALVSVKALGEEMAGLLELKEENYTPESWGGLREAKDAAQLILEKEDASNQEVAEALKAIADARAELEAKPGAADKEALQKAVEALSVLEEEEYTSESWALLKEAKAAAQNVLDKADAGQLVIDKALDDLNKARNGLVKKEIAVDKTKLQAAYDTAAALNEADYTKESFETLKKAKTAAQQILGKLDATQEEVEQVLAALREAVSNLEMKTENPKETITNGQTDGSVPSTTVEGIFGEGAKLEVTPVPAEQEVYQKMMAQLPSNMKEFGVYDVKIIGEATGPFLLSFEVGTEHNGKAAVILHEKADGTIETFNTVVENGIVKVKTDSLSPFLIALASGDETDGGNPDPKPETPGTPGGQGSQENKVPNAGRVQTSDNADIPAALWSLVISGAALLFIRKKK